jgi:cell shape-determining protein MreC
MLLLFILLLLLFVALLLFLLVAALTFFVSLMKMMGGARGSGSSCICVPSHFFRSLAGRTQQKNEKKRKPHERGQTKAKQHKLNINNNYYNVVHTY